MAEKKIIAVVGATGAQGGGLVRAIVSDKSGRFSVQRGDRLRRLTMVMSQLLEVAKRRLTD